MLPWQKASLWLQCFPDSESIESLIGSYLNCGIVYSSQKCFFLIRKCLWDGEFPDFFSENPNAWFVHLAAGDLSDMVKHCPEPMYKLVFQRHGQDRFRCYDSKQFFSKLNK